MKRLPALLLVLALVCLPAVLASADDGSAANEQAAQQDVVEFLSLLRLPAGAVEVDENPAANPALLDSASAPATPNLVDLHQFWRVPGEPAGVRNWIERNLPAKARIVGSASGGRAGQQDLWSVTFGRRPIPDVLSLRQLVATTTPAAGGGTALRVDAQDVWTVPRPAAATVPTGATSLSVLVRGPGPGRRVAARMRVTAPARIAMVRRMLNRLPLVQPGGVIGCPLDRGIRAVLTFRNSQSSTPVARAVTQLGGCGSVFLSIAGVAQPELAGYGLLDDLEAGLARQFDLTEFDDSTHVQPLPVVSVAVGRSPGGVGFRAVAYRDQRLGVCVELFESGVRRGLTCLPHPRGPRSSTSPAFTCYPRALSAMLVLGGAGATGATGQFADSRRASARAYRIKPGSRTTHIGLVNDQVVRLTEPVTVHLGYTGPVMIGFRRGISDLDSVDIAGSHEHLVLASGSFAQC